MLCDMFQVNGSTDLASGDTFYTGINEFDSDKLNRFIFSLSALHIGFCFIDVLYIPYGILYYVNRIYFVCLLSTPPADVWFKF